MLADVISTSQNNCAEVLGGRTDRVANGVGILGPRRVEGNGNAVRPGRRVVGIDRRIRLAEEVLGDDGRIPCGIPLVRVPEAEALGDTCWAGATL